MTANIIKELKGHSGCLVYLMQDAEKFFVRKIGHVERNTSKLLELQNNYAVPKIYAYNNFQLDMEYVHGLDIKSFLIDNDPDELLNFLLAIGKTFTANTQPKNYTDTVNTFLESINFDLLPFYKEDLLDALNLNLWSSNYHGDLTFENLIYRKHKFVMIDCASGVWDSWLFDLVKLRQDLDCFWFMRDNHAMIENKLHYIKTQLIKHWPEMQDNKLLILMLLRVFKHCTNNVESNFILKNIMKLWK